MRTMTRGKAALAGVMALGLALVATPAYAEDAEHPAPTLEVTETVFSAGSWGAGIEYTVTGVPDDATKVTVSLSSMGEMGGGAVVVDELAPGDGVDGEFSGVLTPPAESSPVAPDADGYPVYSVGASYNYLDSADEDAFSSAESVELTITEGMAVDGPNTATVGELAAGVELNFTGFVPNETATGDIQYMDPETFEWSSIGTFSATMGEDGAGTGELTITGATVGDQFRVLVNGEAGSVTHYIEATEGADPQPEPQPKPTPEAPKKPERVETGA